MEDRAEGEHGSHCHSRSALLLAVTGKSRAPRGVGPPSSMESSCTTTSGKSRRSGVTGHHRYRRDGRRGTRATRRSALTPGRAGTAWSPYFFFDEWCRLSMALLATSSAVDADGRWSPVRRSRPCHAVGLSQYSWYP
eukprot:5340876-Prymnesium_polylepis.1